MPNFVYNSFRGLQLPLDPRRLVEPFAFEGKNFVPAVDGIKSEFGARLILAQTEQQRGMQDTRGATTINLPNHEISYFCTREGIFEISSPDYRLVPRFRVPEPPLTVYKWTAAEVGDRLFFARRDIGLVSFDVRSGLWQLHTDLYDDIIACTEIDGRLFLMTGTVVAWSAIDDGLDLTTAVATGAGAQSLSIIGVNDRDDVITCLPYEQGVITYTRGGYLRSERIETPLIFRHRAVFTRHESPLNDFAVVEFTQQQHLWLSLRGFFVQDGRNPPQPWQPLTAEFIREKVKLLSPERFNRARLHYAPIEGWLLVSLDEEENVPGSFDICYVYVIITDSWGVFNRPHSGWHSVQLLERRLSTCYTTIEQQALYQLTTDNYLESLEEMPAPAFAQVLLLYANLSNYPLERIRVGMVDTYEWIEEFQADAFLFHEIFELSRGWFMLSQDASEERSYMRDDISYTFLEFPRLALDSSVALGLFRMPPGAEIQQLSCLDEYIVASDTQLQERQDHIDYAALGLTTDIVVDFENPTHRDVIDNAEAIRDTSVVAISRVVSSLDGTYNRQGNQRVAIIDPVAGSERAQLWRTESYGLYHSIHFEAFEPEEAFFIRSIDLNLRPSGVHP